MKASLIVKVAFGAGMGACVVAGSASAAIFDFSFSGGGFSGSGEFFATGTPGDYLVYDVTGTASDPSFNGGTPSMITGVNGFFGYADNILFYPNAPLVDNGGIGLSTADGNQYNVATGESDTGYVVYDAANPVVPAAGVSFTVTQIPEPATWAMMGLGFAALGLSRWRSRKRAA